MMGKSGTGKSYTYDSQGRCAEIILHRGALGEISRTYSYNDHGDVVGELTTFTRSQLPFGVPLRLDDTGNLVPEKPQSEWPPQPKLPRLQVVHHTYQYDSYGNWTEHTVTHSQRWKYTRGRELTYY